MLISLMLVSAKLSHWCTMLLQILKIERHYLGNLSKPTTVDAEIFRCMSFVYVVPCDCASIDYLIKIQHVVPYVRAYFFKV